MIDQIEKLRERAKVFNEAMTELEASRVAVRLDPPLRAQWERLMLDGAGIKSAIQTATRMIDGAAKWVGRVFQTEAVEAIPFADDIVNGTTAGAISAIDHWLEAAQKILPQLRTLHARLDKMNEKERAALAELPQAEKPQSIVPAMLLIAALGGLVLFGDRIFDAEE